MMGSRYMYMFTNTAHARTCAIRRADKLIIMYNTFIDEGATTSRPRLGLIILIP